MSSGKNVAPLTIESALVGDEFIAQAMVIGNDRNFISTLIIPDFDRLKRYAADHGISTTNNHELVKNEAVQTLYRQRVDDLMKNFARYEQIKQFTLLPDEFTEASGELTPTLKVKRKVVSKKFDKEIEEMYARTG